MVFPKNFVFLPANNLLTKQYLSMKKILLTLATLLTASGSLIAFNPAEFSKATVVPPEEIVTHLYLWEWTITFSPFDEYHISKAVNVGFFGNEIYVQGVSDEFHDSWVKGTIDGNKIVMKSGQFFGEDTSYDYYFCAGNIKYVFDEEGGCTGINLNPKDEMVFSYDPDARTFSTTDDYIAMKYEPSVVDEHFPWENSYLAPKAKPLTLVGETPAKPEIIYVDVYDFLKDWTFVCIRMENIGVNGAFLDPEKLFYNIYIDDKLYVFNKDLYHLDADSSNIPYTFDNDDNITHNLYYYHFFAFNETFSKIDAQLNYEFGGTIYRSERSGIDTVAADAEPQTVEYYTLSGVRVAAPTSGLYRKVARSASGITTASKVLLK